MAEIICTIEKHQALFSLIFTLALAVATFLLWRATKKLWDITKEAVLDSRKSSWGTIMLQANRDLFFHDRMYMVRKAIESNKPIFESKGGKCTEQDVEDYIGYFDMLYGFMEDGILGAEITDDNFGGYVEEAYINKEIREYIADLRREMNDEELYEGFEKWGKGELPKS
jgi:hypothetical protein